MNAVFLGLAFAAELAAWAAIGIGVHALAGGGWQGWLLAITAVAVSIVAWGRWASPKSSAPARLSMGTKVGVFGAGVILIVAAGHPWWAVGLAALILVAHLGARLTGGAPN